MSWINSFRQARFRNASFFVPSAENSGGRRLAVNEFPKEEKPDVEDMGRKARRYNIEAYILGDEYFGPRDALIDALEKEGPGILVHPYRGNITVSVDSYFYRETVTEGRMVRFNITFVESGERDFPTSVVDTVKDVMLKKQTALDACKTALSRVYSIAQVPYSISQNAISTIDKGLDLIGESKRIVSSVSDFSRDLENAQGRVIQLAYDVVDLGQETVDLLSFGTLTSDDFPATAENSKDQFFEMKDMWDYVPEEQIILDSPADQYADFFQNVSIVNGLSMLAIIEYSNLEEAVELRDIAFKKLEEILISISDDDLYISLYALRTAVARDSDVRGRSLPRLASFTPNVSLPAIVHSYSLYGTIDEEHDIIERNAVRHPGMVPGGIPLEVKISV